MVLGAGIGRRQGGAEVGLGGGVADGERALGGGGPACDPALGVGGGGEEHEGHGEDEGAHAGSPGASVVAPVGGWDNPGQAQAASFGCAGWEQRRQGGYTGDFDAPGWVGEARLDCQAGGLVGGVEPGVPGAVHGGVVRHVGEEYLHGQQVRLACAGLAEQGVYLAQHVGCLRFRVAGGVVGHLAGEVYRHVVGDCAGEPALWRQAGDADLLVHVVRSLKCALCRPASRLMLVVRLREPLVWGSTPEANRRLRDCWTAAALRASR